MTDHPDRPVPTSPKQPTASSRPGGSVESKAIRVVINSYWVDDDPEAQALEVARYLRVLQGCSAQEILDAFAEWEGCGPKDRRGRPLKPTPHDLRRLVMKERRMRDLSPRQITQASEPEPRRGASPEQANGIVQESGYTPEHFARVKRFPLARSREALEALDDENQEREPHWTAYASPDRLEHLEKVRDANPLIQEARLAAAAAARRKAAAGDDAA